MSCAFVILHQRKARSTRVHSEPVCSDRQHVSVGRSLEVGAVTRLVSSDQMITDG